MKGDRRRTQSAFRDFAYNESEVIGALERREWSEWQPTDCPDGGHRPRTPFDMHTWDELRDILTICKQQHRRRQLHRALLLHGGAKRGGKKEAVVLLSLAGEVNQTSCSPHHGENHEKFVGCSPKGWMKTTNNKRDRRLVRSAVVLLETWRTNWHSLRTSCRRNAGVPAWQSNTGGEFVT